MCVFVEAVEQNQIEIFLVVREKFRPVADDEIDALGVFRQFEKLPRGGDHGRFDFHYGEMRERVIAIQEFGQRSRAQADQQYLARPLRIVTQHPQGVRL